jgi:transposase
MFGLVDHRTSDKGRHRYPDVVAGTILYLKQLYPAIHYREIVRIIERKYGYKTNHHTVKAFLERNPIPVQLPLPMTAFPQFEDAYRARFTAVRMYYEGWHQQSIANCLGLSRKHVWHILTVFQQEGFAALEDQRTRPATHPENQLTLPFLAEVLEVQQEYPRAGRFWAQGIVAQRTGQAPSGATIGRAMAINRLHRDALPAWSTDRQDEDPSAGVVKALLYEPTYRHHYWYIDFRYLVRIGEDQHWVYSLLIIEGYSRKILAGMAMERVVTTRGHVSVQRFYLYAERGLSRRRVAIRLNEGWLHVAYQGVVPAHYASRYDRKARRLRAVSEPHLHHTVYASP